MKKYVEVPVVIQVEINDTIPNLKAAVDAVITAAALFEGTPEEGLTILGVFIPAHEYDNEDDGGQRVVYLHPETVICTKAVT
jgi:hypothetical protein